MKYIIIALLLIGTVKGQDSLGLQVGHGQFNFIELICQDSIGMCAYQKPDSPFVVIGDSARVIKVLAESLDHTGKFRVRWPVRPVNIIKSFTGPTVRIDSAGNVRWVRETWENIRTVEFYPWWKKALWVILGIIVAAIVFVIAEVTGKKDFRDKDDAARSSNW